MVGEFKFVRRELFLLSLFVLVILPGCFDSKPKPIGGTSISTSSSESSTSGSTNQYCSLFAGNSRDYQLCLGCLVSTNSHDLNTLAQCVHANAGTTGGASCTGLSCGAGQVPNFGTCSCDNTNTGTSSGGGTVGSDPTDITPYMFTGFSVTNRYCPNTVSTANQIGCFWGWTGRPGDNNPTTFNEQPINVFTDAGYLRWDLGMDNSQIPAFYSNNNDDYNSNLSFKGTWSTIPGNFTLSYLLKPNTAIYTPPPPNNNQEIQWCDCIDQFSAQTIGAGSSQKTVTTNNNSCLNSSNACRYASTLTNGIGGEVKLPLTGTSSGTANLLNVSLNGPASNLNVTTISNDAPLTMGSNLKVNVGIGKEDNNTTYDNTKTGLLSNIAKYNFSFGPLKITRPNSNTIITSNTVTNSISINTNLGFTPVSAVESSAFGIDAVTTQNVTTRACNDDTDPCVVSAFYRSTGGTINYRSFSPRFPSQASTIGSLPSGIFSVSTPKVIEDVSQLSAFPTKPARLRVFTRASDGNIYMSKGETGNWSNWVSLGRPWLSNVAASSNSVAPIYWAFTTNFKKNGVNAFPNPLDIANIYDINAGHGISLVGEPSVAYYDHNTAINLPSIILIASRVSHIKEDGSLGKYHNSIFYTVGRATGSTLTTANSFDNAFNWSRWQPIIYSGTNIQYIQGNPTITLEKNSSGNLYAYVYATDLQGIKAHPPVAPRNNPSGYPAYETPYSVAKLGDCTNLGNDTCKWFNYGKSLVQLKLDVTPYETITPGSNTCTITNWIDGGGTTTTASNALYTNESCNYVASASWTRSIYNLSENGRIMSDWSLVKFPNQTTGFSIRVYANANYSFKNNDPNCRFANGPIVAPIAEVRSNSSCGQHGQRSFLATFEFNLESTGTLIANDSNFQYKQINFIGTPYPIALPSENRYTAPTPDSYTANYRTFIDPEAGLLSGSAPHTHAALGGTQTFFNTTNDLNSKRMLIFGRHIDNKAINNLSVPQYVSTIYPLAGNSTSNNSYSVYRPSKSILWNGWTYIHHITPEPLDGFIRVQSFNPTSDIIPIFSNSLKKAKVDVPVYLFSRDQSGNLTMGYWASSNNGQGLKTFMFSPIGGYLN